MSNPFVYGKEVMGAHFCNREEEIRELLSDVRNAQNVMIYSPRRYGKTSLIKQVLERARVEGVHSVFVDLYPVLEEKDLIALFASAVPAGFGGKIEQALQMARSLFSRLIPQITVDDSGKPIVQFSFDPNQDIKVYLEDIFSALESYSEKGDRKVAVVFDEFQQIGLFKNDRIEKMLRSRIQTHRNISYIFMGSQQHLIYDMFHNPSRPFYRSCKPFRLKKIAKEPFVRFIREKFDQTSKSIPAENALEIVAFCEQHPYYVQYLSNIVWDRTEAAADERTVRDAVSVMLERESVAFENIWELLTVRQRQILRALSRRSKDEAIYNGSGAGLPASTIHLSLKSLEEKGLITREGKAFEFTDLIFKKWVASSAPFPNPIA